jgi:hypothetical protein
MPHSLIASLPGWIQGPLRRVRDTARIAAYRGDGRYCPVCENSSSRFRSFGLVPREDAQCVHCGALERHRLLWLFLSRKTDLFDGAPKTILHVAPEKCLQPRLESRFGESYVTADLFDPSVKVKMDITDIHYPDRHFDVIYCSHVLEHVEDDRKAMSEFHRVLADDGWAVLLVPITAERTFEDPSIVDPQERLRVFGQEDHVRRYGPDYLDRLQEAGFRVTVTTVADLVEPEEGVRMGLTAASGDIYYCVKWQ